MDLEILTVAMQSIRAVRDILKAVNGLQLDIATLGDAVQWRLCDINVASINKLREMTVEKSEQ